MNGAPESQAEEPRRSSGGPRAEINVTPLVDVVLVLLIIFMVVAPQMEAGVTVELPAASHPDAEAQGALEPTTLSIAKDGTIFFDKEPLARDALVAKLKALHEEKPDTRLTLKADKAVAYEKVRSLFKACQQLGFPGASLQVIDKANQQH
ncbi:MAG: biopolymer transporter ExbD [Myxococcaceae bacterium]|nr:biopolymer transporter ExbD [Myxococcaceae bacterium]